MSQMIDLGPGGEETLQRLRDVYDLTDTYEPCLLLSEHSGALAEVRARLAEHVGRVELWEPEADLLDRARALAGTLGAEEPKPVIWVEQAEFEPEAWARALASLNWKRETFIKEAPWVWVLGGPGELLDLFKSQAPDLLSGVSVRLNVPEPRILPAGSRRFRWLHLSDFHFEAAVRWQREATLQGLLRHAEKLVEEDRVPDFVFITGDIAQSGKRKEYEQAELFFRELAKTLKLEPKEHFFFVPGNHDVDRSKIEFVDRTIVQGLKDQDSIEDLFADKEGMKLLARRLEEYYAFTERLLGPVRAWRETRPYRVDVREVGGVEVGILQLNSAWVSGPDDEARGLLVGEAQLRDVLEEAADTFVRIALVHHPIADLREFDQERISSLLGAPGGAHFLLRGHRHKGRALNVGSPDGVVMELAAGAAYTLDRWPRGFLETEVDLAAGAAKVGFFGYSDSGRGFWARDTKLYERAPEGIWEVALPAELRLAGETPAPTTGPLSASRRATLTERYRQAAAAYHGTIRFLGFADSRPRLNVQVPEIFVPLKLREFELDGEEPLVWETAELLRYLLEGQDGKHPTRRAVVLGDPGSGKTTLCRFATVVLAGDAELDGFEVPAEVLPLFLPFREYVRQCRENGDLSLLAFLEEQARGPLGLSFPEGFLEEALDAGNAVLLLDGLDEVGSAGEREEMRSRVSVFARQYPRVPMLVTSRIAGYDDAPLRQRKEREVWAFRHFRIDPFDDAALRDFVQHWYEAQEASDPVARERGITELTAALEADPRVQDLARNPMLATLIALVHRYEAHLPGERAKLYELCIKTLLETWPKARRRAFREIDEGLQRAYLEDLAYRMQLAREAHQGEVTIERDKLYAWLKEIIIERGELGKPPEVVERITEQWVRYLEEGTGLFVEQQPGIFAFFHLSFMEYLAARGMEKAEALEERVAKHHKDSKWREVCLLAVGGRATDRIFLEKLYERLSESSSRTRWSFLLSCLKEEVAFVEEREMIMREAGKEALGYPPAFWYEKQRVVEDILRFSVRHSEWLKKWLDRQLEQAAGDDLRGVIALIFPSVKEILEVLGRRSDVHLAAVDLLDYWPQLEVAHWAVKRISKPAAFGWGRSSAAELQVWRSLAAFNPSTGGEKLAPGLLVGLVSAGVRAIDTACQQLGWPGGGGKPTDVALSPAIRVEPRSIVVRCFPRWPNYLRVCVSNERDYFALGVARNAALRVAESLVEDVNWRFSIPFILDMALAYARQRILRAVSGKARSPPSGSQPYSTDPNEMVRNAKELFEFSSSVLGPIVSGWVLPEKINEWLNSRPDLLRTSPDLEALLEARVTKKKKAVEEWAAMMITRFSAEASVAGLVDFGDEDMPAEIYARRRLDNACLLHLWPGLDEKLGPRPCPDHLALYLALGWTQSTTTWQWPPSERWVELLGGPPPEHWMPRSQWHLAWMLHYSQATTDPKYKEHHRALDEALEEGLTDEERPGLAEALRELFPPMAE